MMPQEWNYLIADKEMLLVIQALEQWHHYLEDARHQFEIWNDHANLQWFMQRQDLNQQQVCWAQYLSRFNVVRTDWRIGQDWSSCFVTYAVGVKSPQSPNSPART